MTTSRQVVWIGTLAALVLVASSLVSAEDHTRRLVPSPFSPGGFIEIPNAPSVRPATDTTSFPPPRPLTPRRPQGRFEVVTHDRHTANSRYLLQEYGVGDYLRTFRVGEEIDPERISAEMRNGVLTVHLPKTERVKPRRIPVKTT